MTDLRTAAQQALEALSCLEYDFCGITDGPSDDTTEAAITALRAALAEPAQEPQCNPHPKAPHSFMRNASHNEHRYVCECEGWEPYEAGYQAGMEAALVEPVHEPPTDWEAVAADQAMTIALNTTPPQRKPLTGEEIQELSRQHKFDSRMEKFVRIIEIAHGIKDD